MEPTLDLYETLGLAKDCDYQEIRGAYRRLSKVRHPDAGGDPVKFHEIALAHKILMNPDSRRLYDETGFAAEIKEFELQREIASVITTLFDKLLNLCIGEGIKIKTFDFMKNLHHFNGIAADDAERHIELITIELVDMKEMEESIESPNSPLRKVLLDKMEQRRKTLLDYTRALDVMNKVELELQKFEDHKELLKKWSINYA